MTNALFLENPAETAVAAVAGGSGSTTAALTQQTAQFTSITTNTDPVSGLVDRIYSGFQTSLSAVLAGLPATKVNSISIFADTLVLDVPAVNTSGLILMVRELDVSGLNGQPLTIAPDAGNQAAAQFLVGAATGGTFSVAMAAQPSAVTVPPVSMASLNAAGYVAEAGGALTAIPSGPASVQDLVSRSWALNSLQASFAGAAWLIDNGSPDSRTAAQQMLGWVVQCTSSLATAELVMPSNYAQLYNQAAALVVTLNVAAGAYYVPVLSGDYYTNRIGQLLTVLQDYESRMATLDTQTDISAAVASVSASLKDTAGIEVGPLQVQLDNISANTKSLFADIMRLRGDFLLQSQTASTAFNVLGIAIALDGIKQRLKADLEMAVSVISLGFDAVKVYEGDAEGLKSGIEDGAKAIENLIELIETMEGGDSGDDLSQAAVELLESQQALMGSVLNGRLLWQQALANQSGGVLPASLAAITLDPATSWDNYVIGARTQIGILKRSLESDAQDKADLYLASLEILAGYGKAISSTFVAYVAQLVQATVVIAQIKAAKDVEATWAATQANATSEAEQLAALKALVQARANAVKRSIYVAWTYYASSYFYLTFSAPPRTLHVDMSAAEFADALSGVAEWVASAIQQTSPGNAVMLPSTQAQIELDFTIVQPGSEQSPSDAALLQQNADGGWSLRWVVPLGTSQLEGVLPNGGLCAIWISNATFLLDGVTANSKGNVIALVGTSGTYQNGFGPQAAHTFVTKGLQGNYGYHVAAGTVFIPWSIDASVYMTPTPYTQWTMTLPPDGGDPRTATRLRAQFTIAFLTPAA
jgi:hypothetical protein